MFQSLDWGRLASWVNGPDQGRPSLAVTFRSTRWVTFCSTCRIDSIDPIDLPWSVEVRRLTVWGVVWFVVNEKGLLRKVILPFGVLWRLLLVLSPS